MRGRHSAPIGSILVVVLLLMVLLAASCGSSGTTTTTAVPATTAMPAGGADGAALYTANCSGCHKDLPSGNAAEVGAVIVAGKEDMPAFQDTLTAEEIAAIVIYVTSGGK
jgi:mono/diheme cytochrome c family protein